MRYSTLLLGFSLLFSTEARAFALKRATGQYALIGNVRFGGPLLAAVGGHLQLIPSDSPQLFLSPTIGVNGYSLMAGIGAAGTPEGPAQSLAPMGFGLHAGYLHINKLSTLDGKSAVWIKKDSTTAQDFLGFKITAAFGIALEFSTFWSQDDKTVIHSFATGIGF